MVISKLGETKNNHEEQDNQKELKAKQNKTKTAIWCSQLTVKKQGNLKSCVL